ncbi:DUF1907-domain-containing protein [Stipitochalara longipes BDJ]|nr:DUF1907-domain-containing protein [Stipitochalara longipes BDJ]
MTSPSSLPIKTYPFTPPHLSELASLLTTNLPAHFCHVSASVVPCPDLQQSPFHLAAAGLGGNERIADVGGPPYLHPLPNFTKKYSFLSLAKLLGMSQDRGFMLGAGAGPFHVVGRNSELMPNMSYSGKEEVVNLTKYAKVDEQGGCFCGPVPGNSTDFALMANLFCSDGDPGDVLRIVAKARTSKENFTSAIQSILKQEYGDLPVSLGGVFLIKKGKAMLHVMPDFSKEPLDQGKMKEWLKFYEVEAPLVCLSTFHSHDPGLGLRMEHTHCFAGDGGGDGDGGHYHFDTTAEEVEYEAYFNTAKVIYRVDQPPVDH